MNTYLLIFFGGGIGCIMRYFISSNAYIFIGRSFPYGTLIVNITGSLLMGILFVLILDRFSSIAPQLRAFLLVGFLGGYTTFSSFSIETLNLFEQGEILKAALNVIASVVLCLAAAWLGVIIGRHI